MVELPFVVGVLSDLSGKPEEPLPPLDNEKRRFVQVDRDNFNKFLEGIAPRLPFTVENKLTKEGGKLRGSLRFKNLDDFHPEKVAEQVDPLKQLLDARRRLNNLLAKIETDTKLRAAVEGITSDAEKVKNLRKEGK
jgi:type VI secretion system protein ImpB